MADPLSGLWLVYVAVHAVTVVTQVGIALWVYRNQWHRSGAKWFLVMVGTGIMWVLPVLVFFLPGPTPLRKAAYLLAMIGAMATVCAFVVFTSRYTGSGVHRNRLVQAHLVVVLAGTVVLATTNSVHGFIVASFTPVTEPFPHLAIERGLVF